MTRADHKLTPADIMDMSLYAAERRDRRRAISAVKKQRRVEVGPVATFYFENYDTMWYQIHEMLHIEKGGEAQIADELRAYNSMIPNGRELVATLMFEIDEETRRDKFLRRLGGVEQCIRFDLGGEVIAGVPEDEVERTDAAGRASSVHFIHFPFTDAQIARFRDPGVAAVLGVAHPAYGHMAVVPEAVRAALAADFD